MGIYNILKYIINILYKEIYGNSCQDKEIFSIESVPQKMPKFRNSLRLENSRSNEYYSKIY